MIFGGITLLLIGACTISNFYKLDYIDPRGGGRWYFGQGCYCWLSYDSGESPGLHLRGPDYSICIGDTDSWQGTDIFGVQYFEVGIQPLAFGAGLLTLAGAIGVLAARRRIKPGSCASCNYDLTGNQSGICPECGNAIQRD